MPATKKSRKEGKEEQSEQNNHPTTEMIGEKTFQTSPDFIKLLLRTEAQSLWPADGRIFICQRTDKVVDVWQGLIRHNFLSVPVLQKTKDKYYGFVDLADIVMFVLRMFGDEKLNIDRDFWEMYKQEEYMAQKTVNDIMVYPISRRNPFSPVKKGYTLFSSLELLAKEPGLHRIPVIDQNRKLVNIITQSQVLKFIHDNMNILGTVRNKPVTQFPTYNTHVHVINENEKAIDAFKLMTSHHVSGMAVINDQGKLVGNISLRDLKAIASDGRFFWRLYQTVKNFLQKIKREFQEKDGRPKSVVVATSSDTLEDVIKKIVQNGIHRVFIVDENHKPTGVISLKDILLEIITSC